MITGFRRATPLVAALLLGLAAALPAQAGMIRGEALERERVKAMLERPELAGELREMGIAPQEAAARVDAMSDAEVRSLAGRLDALPAGGRLSNQDLLLVIIVVLLAIIIF